MAYMVEYGEAMSQAKIMWMTIWNLIELKIRPKRVKSGINLMNSKSVLIMRL